MLVNVASRCGFTKSGYEYMNYLHTKYSDKGLRVIAFPANDFAKQEPGADPDIEAFARERGANFVMMRKAPVKGPEARGVFQFLGEVLGAPKWNFTSYVFDRSGNPAGMFSPSDMTQSESLIQSLL